MQRAHVTGSLTMGHVLGESVRDMDTDRRAGKRTLVVRIGRLGGRRLYAAMLALAFLSPVVIWAAGGLSAWIVLSLLALPLAPPLVRTVGTRTDGASLNAALAGTGRLLAVYSLLLSIGVLAS